MMMHIQTWDNGKYGRIWAVGDDDYSWKFTEIINGCASEEDFEKSSVIASHFIGYCINNEPKGEGDIYTPFFTLYYNKRLETFRKKHINDISLIRDPKRLESKFQNEHFKEERQSFENSKALFEFDASRDSKYTLLYFGYLTFLREKMPRYFVFKEYTVPVVFLVREFDIIVESGYRSIDSCLNKVLDKTVGRVYPSDLINGCSPSEEDTEQIKTVYGDSVNPPEVYYIRFNYPDKKKTAQSVYDEFRLNLGQKVFKSETEKRLIEEHAERWYHSVMNTEEQKHNIEVVKRQLDLCLRPIDENNLDDHKPFYGFNYQPLDDVTVLKMEGYDRYGYPVAPYNRLNDVEFKAMMEAFDKWASMHYGNGNSKEGEQTPIKPLSDSFNAFIFGMYSSMNDEKIIENIDYLDFVNYISQADFSTMHSIAKSNRNQNRLFVIINRIKTWFPEEWEQRAATSMGTTVERLRKVSPKETQAAHKAWYRDLDKSFPIHNPVQ